MIARPILRALDYVAVRLMAFALRHGVDPDELRGQVRRSYRHKGPLEAQAAASSKLQRAQARNTARAARRGRAILP